MGYIVISRVDITPALEEQKSYDCKHFGTALAILMYEMIKGKKISIYRK